MKYVYQVTTESIGETRIFAANLAQCLIAGDVLALDGDLGAGKTAFAQGLAQGLEITTPVASPTFTLLVEYDEGRIPLYHFDVYRLSGIDEWYDSGFDDYLTEGGIVVIEWAEKVQEALPGDRYCVKLEMADANNPSTQRRITLAAPRPLNSIFFKNIFIDGA